MIDPPTPRAVFLQSLRRCSESEDFIPAFYKRFLESSDEVRHKFRFTDFELQNKMLQRSLELCAGATIGEPEALREIHERATTHDRRHLNIESHLYDFWLESIIQTASVFDQQWDKEIEFAWRRILGHVVEHMIRHY